MPCGAALALSFSPWEGSSHAGWAIPANGSAGPPADGSTGPVGRSAILPAMAGTLLIPLCTLLPPLAGELVAAPGPVQAPARTAQAEIAARGMGATITHAEYDELIMNRHARSDGGRAALEHLLKSRLLEQLAVESGLAIGAEQIDARMDELDEEIRAGGDPTGLEGQLREYRIDLATFRHFLELQIVQETLARRALGIPDGRPIQADQQEMWVNQVLDERGSAYPEPPYEGEDPVLARCGSLEVRRSEFLPHFKQQLDPETAREDCYQLLLAKLIRARMPDLADEALAREVEREIERRRAEFRADPQNEGVTFEQVLAARGLRLDRLDRDPAFVVASLARLWVDRTHGEEGLRATYEAERNGFDDRFGPAVPVSVLFLNAVEVANPLQRTTFEQAEQRLREVAKVINGPEAFAVAAQQYSEDKGTAQNGGRLGYTTRADERMPAELRELAFANQGAGLVGPVRLTQGVSGVALLWIGELRPSPGWEVMREHVHNELRKRLIEQTLPLGSVVTWHDDAG